MLQRVRFESNKACLRAPSTPSNLLLTVPRQYFSCGSSMLLVSMSVCMGSLPIWSTDLQLPIILPVLFCFVI